MKRLKNWKHYISNIYFFHISHMHFYTNCHDELGLGLRISFPVSSQDILKSVNTCRALDATIEGATTRLWIPIKKRETKKHEQRCLNVTSS